MKANQKLREQLRQYRRALPWITIKEFLLIIISTIPYALTVNQLLVPHAIVGGGVTGLCEIIYFATNTYVPIWLSSATINIVLLIIAALTVGWRYALRTIWGVVWLTIWLKVIPIAPVPILTDPFMAVVIGGLTRHGVLPSQSFGCYSIFQLRCVELYRSRMVQYRHAGGYSAEYVGEPRMVHFLHALSSGSEPGSSRSALCFSDDGQRPDRFTTG